MTNHFHLVVPTPKGNLIYGMKWLQSTFANRYHKFRKVHGKLFQGRYKSLIVEEDSHLGALLHYVNLNPVRAGMVSIDQLEAYRWSSYWYLFNKRARPSFLDCSGALEAAGGLADTPKGRRLYFNYLKWLSSDDAAQKEMAFEKMCRGWALGTKDFKKALIEEVESAEENDDKTKISAPIPRYDGESLREANDTQVGNALGERPFSSKKGCQINRSRSQINRMESDAGHPTETKVQRYQCLDHPTD